jgi:Fe(3+) dicitrate transport protein
MKNRIATKIFCTLFIMLFINILNIYSNSNVNGTNPPKGIIRGHITDTHQQPIVGASVFLSGTVRYAATDEQGNFEFRSLDTGVYTIVASLIGFQKQEQKVEIIDDKVQVIDFKLVDLNLTLNELHITYRQPLRGNEHLAEVSELAINATKKNEVIILNRLDANLAMNTTRQIFGRTPGIHIWESDASGIQIGVAARGLSPNRSWEFNVRMNSYDITPDPMGYPEAYFTPPLEAVERVELIRGASSLAWGSQFGGLMNFVMRKPDAAKRFTFESQNTVGSNGLFSSFNYAGGIEGRTTYAAFYQKRVGDGWRNNNLFNTDHAHAELSFAISNKFRIGAELTYMNYLSQQPGGLTDSMFAADAQQSIRSRNWFSAPWLVPALTASYIFNKHTHLNIKTFGTIGDRNSIGYVGAISQKDPLKYRQIDRDYYRNWGSEARLLHSFQWLGQTQTFNTGLRYFDGNMQRQQLGRGDSTQSFNLNLQESQFPRDLTFKNQNFAVFVEQLLRINNRLILTAGARFERIQTHAEGRFNTVNGQAVALTPTTRTRQFGLFGAGIEYHLTQQSEFYSNISQAYRPVLYSDLVPPATTDVIDPNLKDAVGFNFDLGYRGKISNWLSFDVDYFYLDYANRIGTITQTQASGTKYQYRTNLGQSVSQGFEGYLEWAPIALLAPNAQLGQLSLFGSMSFINAKYVDFQTNTGNLQDKRVENAPQYIHRFGATYHKKGFSATWQFSNVGAAFADASNTVLPNAAATTGIIPAYQVHDVSATWRFAQRYQLKTGVNNVTNEKYFTRRAGGYPGPGLLPADGRTWYFSVGVKL